MFTFRAQPSVVWRIISQAVTLVFGNMSVTFLSNICFAIKYLLNPDVQWQLNNLQLMLKRFGDL